MIDARQTAELIVKRHWGWRDARPEADIVRAIQEAFDAGLERAAAYHDEIARIYGKAAEARLFPKDHPRTTESLPAGKTEHESSAKAIRALKGRYQ